MLKTEVVRRYLELHTHKDLASLYTPAMEVQVNVSQGDGKRFDGGTLQTKSSVAYTDGVETWKSFRIPFKSMSDPVDNDGPVMFNFDKHVEGIGMTGWDYKAKLSRWVAYDFDAMVGHSESHTKKLSDRELVEIQDVITALPFVTLRRSTSGKGLHLYVHLDPVPTSNHTEHAALARSILSYIAGITSFNFADKVDICGGNMWVFHRKMLGTNGLSLIKNGETLKHVPKNWKDHINVICRKKTKIGFSGGSDANFDELSGQRAKVKLDADHRALIAFLDGDGSAGWWDSDNHMLVTHTHYLDLAHTKLTFKGQFHTNSQGREAGSDINCFAFPLKHGAWVVFRYGRGTAEHNMWFQDGRGFTKCYYNRDLTLADIARLCKAIELESGGYQFTDCKTACEGLLKLGIDVSLPSWVLPRPMKVKESRQESKINVMIPYMPSDAIPEMNGWLVENKFYRRLYHNPKGGVQDEMIALGDYDNMVRHIISEGSQDMGWVINTDEQGWRNEPAANVSLFLASKGIGSKDRTLIMGQAVCNAWRLVNKPFEPEYPGDRQWNRSKARFKIAPTMDGEALNFPTWNRVLKHCGESLDESITNNEWCRANNISNGSDYLKIWFACLIRHPQQPLPFLAFYGPQDSGKTTLHEAFCSIILDGGYMDGATALQSGANFNGELDDAILLTLEEVDLRSKTVYQRVKDYVTSNKILLHVKGLTPIQKPNYTHWIQCVNHPEFIPVFPGDTRITMMYVGPLQDKIPKRDLYTLLIKEAPDFLASLLNMEIPDSKDRLMLPVIKTSEKLLAEEAAMSPTEKFFQEKIFKVDGSYVSIDELHSKYLVWSGEAISKLKFVTMLPMGVIKGRISESSTQLQYIGNVSWEADTKPTRRWMSAGLFLKRI